jgi:hypothetical protein
LTMSPFHPREDPSLEYWNEWKMWVCLFCIWLLVSFILIDITITNRREGRMGVTLLPVNTLTAGVWLLVWEWINAIWLHSLSFWESRAVWAELSWSFCCWGSWSDSWMVHISLCVYFHPLKALAAISVMN